MAVWTPTQNHECDIVTSQIGVRPVKMYEHKHHDHKDLPHIYLHVSFLQAVLVDSLMTIETQSTDKSVALQLTTMTTHKLL